MAKSARKLVPHVIRFFVNEHGDEWSSASRGLLSYQYWPGYGLFIFVRTVGQKRFASFRLLTTVPTSDDEWRAIRKQMLERGKLSPSDAIYRYLVVPNKVSDQAHRSMHGTKVVVLSHKDLETKS
mgnify:CR=1 FL=1